MLLKILTVALVVVTVSSQAPELSNSEVLRLIEDSNVMIPSTAVTGGVTVDDLASLFPCMHENYYDEVEALAEIDTEEEYLCAFIAYQFHKREGSGIGHYEDVEEADMRYPLFKHCVDYTNDLNEEHLGMTEYEVNFFCDMTDEERGVYNNLHDPDQGLGLGAAPGGLGAAPGPLPADGPAPPSNDDIIYMMGERFKIPDTSVTGGVTADDLQLINCVFDSPYDTVAQTAAIDEEREYLCAFVYFQVNKVEGEGIGYYDDVAEATMRYPLFKRCVNYVNSLNAEPDNTAEFEVNFFCDMTQEEKAPYGGSHGHTDEDKLGSSYDGGASEPSGTAQTTANLLLLSSTLIAARHF